MKSHYIKAKYYYCYFSSHSLSLKYSPASALVFNTHRKKKIHLGGWQAYGELSYMKLWLCEWGDVLLRPAQAPVGISHSLFPSDNSSLAFPGQRPWGCGQWVPVPFPQAGWGGDSAFPFNWTIGLRGDFYLSVVRYGWDWMRHHPDIDVSYIRVKLNK